MRGIVCTFLCNVVLSSLCDVHCKIVMYYFSIDDFIVDSTSDGISAGSIAGIVIGCMLSLLTISMVIIGVFTCVYMKQYYVGQERHSLGTTQQSSSGTSRTANVSTTEPSAPPPPPVDIQTHPPVVHYDAKYSDNCYTFQPSDYSSKPPPEYIAEPPPSYPEPLCDYKLN